MICVSVGAVVGWIARPQIYVHLCLDLVTPLSIGSLLRSRCRDREGAGGGDPKRAVSIANNGPDSERERESVRITYGAWVEG